MSGPNIVSTRPRRTYIDIVKQLQENGITAPVALVGCRGYYRDTAAHNERGVYDDGFFLVGPGGFFATFNGNVDPSVFRPGIATLKKGKWRYKIGIHGLSKPKDRQYLALVQAGEVTVSRDGQHDETGWFGINIHRGGETGTSSLGCQTVVPAQWDEFFAAVKKQMAAAGVSVIDYLLVDY